jgi:steroid 5-alpha reductase family enzyme
MVTPQKAKHALTGLALVVVVYAVALVAAIVTEFVLSSHSLTITALVADTAATGVIYIFGRAFRNSSFYDPYWSLAPIAISIYWFLASHQSLGWQQFIVLALVCLWGLRLTWHWISGWRGLGHEDWRYSELRQKAKGWFWLVELMGIDLMPTVVVFLGCLSLYPALTSKHALSPLDVAAIAVTAVAIIIETVADDQLGHFINGDHRPGEIMESGLWSYSRHPNYLGEITFWWGLYLFALASGISNWWMIVGPLTITALFVFISIPLMDKHNAERRPGYGAHAQRVPALLPRFTRP